MKNLFVSCRVRYVNPGHPMQNAEGRIIELQRWHDNRYCMRTGRTLGRYYGWLEPIERSPAKENERELELA